ncbi:phosphate propanoyltransferase [Sporomusa acidovorans]|uniref:Phosphate propanoyltransferase n=1 Tax=Sporomusa acidovorans (strain ATCC 49682 / DSM 3132 / Mol) TaxID=1123286 RepID=A0ABZ3J7B3_SPOA4|nr:phosphate propanoyltransferase [Sporomusa acidovorans]OZC21231.1 phosphate propanoyltransferase [Sporomusa acidovorans DSM 3132]SDE65478.1 Propanediol utilization protein [Sporomusa acidovorans]
MIISEHELRANWNKIKSATMTIPQGSIVTPSARDFLRSQGIQIQYDKVPDGKAKWEMPPVAGQTPRFPQEEEPKPEHMTHLRGKQLIFKTHPVIAWRGQLDQFACDLVETQTLLVKAGETKLAAQLEEVALLAQKVMAAEVKQEGIAFGTVLGWTAEQIRDMSHYPQKYFGTPHTAMSYQDGWLIARLNSLRSKIREVELSANRAFTAEDGTCSRSDIILILNRLSSLFYVLGCKRRREQLKSKQLPIGISNRHVHLSQAHLEKLFGTGYLLHKQKDLSQPGQFAAQESVMLAGPKGRIENVRILGPVRPDTQVEVSVTDCFTLGIRPAVRDSGQIEGTSGITLTGPAGSIELAQGVIVAARHIHLHPDQAEAWNIKDGQRVNATVESERSAIFQDVLVRVSPHFKGELHLDTDEANAALVKPDTQCVILEV